MAGFNFTLYSLLYLTMVLFSFYIVYTLLQISPRPSFIRAYMIYNLVTGLYFLVLFLENSLVGPLAAGLTTIIAILLLSGIISAIYFGYSFGEDYFKKERKVVLIILLVMLAGQTFYTIVNHDNSMILFNIKDQIYVNMGDFLYFLMIPLGNLLVSIIFFRKSIRREKEVFPDIQHISLRHLEDDKAGTFAKLGLITGVNFLSSLSVLLSEILFAYKARSNAFFFIHICILMIETLIMYQIVISSRYLKSSISHRIISVVMVLLFILLSLGSTLNNGIQDRYYDNSKFSEVSLLKGYITENNFSKMPGDVKYILRRQTNNIFFDTNINIIYSNDPNVTMSGITTAYGLLLNVLMPRYNDTNLVMSNTVMKMEKELDFNARNIRIIGSDMVDLNNFYYCFYFEDKGSYYEIGYGYMDYRDYMHKHTTPSIILFLSAFIIISLLLPLLLKGSVIRPLNGLLEVISAPENQSDLQKRKLDLPSDEIGYFTGAFIDAVTELQITRDNLSEMNISLEKRIEERTKDLILARDKADEASRAKSNFLSHMSHEIRTPLNAIINMNRLLADTPLNQTQQEHNNISLNASEMLLNLVNDVLDFSKIEAQKLSISKVRFNIRDIIYSVTDIIQSGINDSALVFKREIDENIPYAVIGDPDRLQQVLLNLLSNAVKFTEEGEVKLSVVLKSQNAKIIRMSFSITDTGIGISSANMEHIFESFYQGDSSTMRKYRGTGLGLPISKKLVELMGGVLSIDSILGKGTTFSFSLPFIKAKTRDSSRKDRSRVQNKNVYIGLRVLVVEDDLLNRKVIQSQLSNMGIEPDMVVNGKEAVKIFKTGDYDIILMDLEMPEMDGFEAARLIRESLDPSRIITIIAVSAYLKSEIKEKDLAGIFDDILQKPLDPMDVELIFQKFRPEWNSENHTDSISVKSNTHSIFDKECLLARISDDESLYRECVEAALVDLPDKLEQLQKTFKDQDILASKRSVHGLQGMGNNLCAQVFTDSLIRLEKALKSKLENDVENILGDVVTHGQQLVHILNDERRSWNIS